MTQLEKMHKFMDFWFSPWGAAKGARWEGFSRNSPQSDWAALRIVKWIMDGTDEQHLDWSALA